MNPTSPLIRHIAVIGGGISGLAAAHRMIELDPTVKVTLIESKSRLGGVIESTKSGDYLTERSADSFITSIPWAINLCQRIGFDSELLRTNDKDRRAFIVSGGKLHEVPEGFLLMAPGKIWPIIKTPLLSTVGKLRLFAEVLVPERTDSSDESLASFVTRRLGRETFERIVQPLIGGIYTADPDKLSLKATLPRFIEMERKHGSLIRAALADRPKEKTDHKNSGARYSMFVTPRRGLSSLIEAIADRLPDDSVLLNSEVQEICKLENQRWEISLTGTQNKKIEVDAVIVATPAFQTAKLLQSIDNRLATDLRKIQYAGCSIVTFAMRREQIQHPLDGFGFVVPLIEKRQILSASFSSVKFQGRAPNGEVIIRTFIGGACQPGLALLPDDELKQIALRELGELIGFHGEPTYCQISRWQNTMPQYHLGHLDLVDRIEKQTHQHDGLALAGNAYRGVGIPFCVHSGEKAAESILKNL